jgi:hypothetical protein
VRIDLEEDILSADHKTCFNGDVITSSLSKFKEDFHIYPLKNGFVDGAVHAYSNHHHLTLRPEYIWFAIISQLCFYINAHAEDLRDIRIPRGSEGAHNIPKGHVAHS